MARPRSASSSSLLLLRRDPLRSARAPPGRARPPARRERGAQRRPRSVLALLVLLPPPPPPLPGPARSALLLRSPALRGPRAAARPLSAGSGTPSAASASRAPPYGPAGVGPGARPAVPPRRAPRGADPHLAVAPGGAGERPPWQRCGRGSAAHLAAGQGRGRSGPAAALSRGAALRGPGRGPGTWARAGERLARRRCGAGAASPPPPAPPHHQRGPAVQAGAQPLVGVHARAAQPPPPPPPSLGEGDAGSGWGGGAMQPRVGGPAWSCAAAVAEPGPAGPGGVVPARLRSAAAVGSAGRRAAWAGSAAVLARGEHAARG
ncbi:uncharacterized protein J5F26_010176 [Ciconia maguari]